MRKSMILIVIIVIYQLAINNRQSTAQTPRPEYPRPQFERTDWINLNGEWSYTFDFGKSGMERNFMTSKGFNDKILVPFCPESKLSGVGNTDFIEMMWYHRKIEIPAEWKNKRVIIHFGAVDYESELFIDGKSVGIHFGGTSSFSYDITDKIIIGKQHNLVLYVRDEIRSWIQPSGKQCEDYKSRSCKYTRTTGIWQTVWLEPVSKIGLMNCNVIPDLDNKKFVFTPCFYSYEKGMKFRVKLFDKSKKIAEKEIFAGNNASCEIIVNKPKTWSPENPFLYNISYQVINKNGKVIDEVESYAGMRKVHVEGNKVYLNNKPYYLRLVLDQGFYPDGIWTAPNDEALKNDIELSMKAGFNGGRLHQKVFEERFHYWADKLGYLTWGESSSWGMGINDPLSARNFISEWEEIVVRDRNHPSIITWVPHNETWDRKKSDGRQHDRFLIDVYDLTKNLDPTRPISETSGHYHVKTDLWTIHVYEQDPDKFKEILTPSEKDGVHREDPKYEIEYTGQPYILDEYGGIRWVPERNFSEDSWGYGNDPKTLDEFYTRLEGLTDATLRFSHIWGYCYTQLTDVEQEQNGIYNYDRTTKFDMEKIRKIFSKTPETVD